MREYIELRDAVRFGLKPVGESLADCRFVDMKTEWEEQLANVYAELERRDWYEKPAVKRQALRRDALILDTDRDPTDVVLRRTRALLDELLKRVTGTLSRSGPEGASQKANLSRLFSCEQRLRRLEETAAEVAPRLVDARHALFFEICRLRRCIAFENPLLDFDRILFVKRQFLRWGGGLIVVDPLIPDDRLMTKLKRLTPEAPFPWREMSRYTGPLDYGTPWPLGELFCLCVYDSDSAIEKASGNNYGIYLVDAFGNQELLYRDPQISCLSPIALEPRPKPPSITHATVVGKLQHGSPRPGTEVESQVFTAARVGLINVYDSYFRLPKDVEITHLRVVQVAHKSVSGRNVPVLGYGTGAGLDKGGRMVLGTVPVEEDGSAYFTMPAGVPVYFQALDSDGLAVQTMRSITYVHPGERLVCMGCHEKTHKVPQSPSQLPLALQRGPSSIEPDVDGSYPLTFPRLVQPVLDRQCVECHEKDPQKAPSLARGDWKKHPYEFFDSYVNLEEYVHCFPAHSGDTERTLPGTFGARASKLYHLLKAGHYDLKLAKEELHRLALWMDCNARFFAACRELDKQAQGEIVTPALE